ncbi:Conserved_hypothetical protein [Hexamita inflata]|uniref:Uncharacterized protein n=1 Tax=Hexamita inflata TaxID=28002 RepID=A0AA86U2D7_9EUKA|nr:Conserved hypothetical protein [Hexamita inflata]
MRSPPSILTPVTKRNTIRTSGIESYQYVLDTRTGELLARNGLQFDRYKVFLASSSPIQQPEIQNQQRYLAFNEFDSDQNPLNQSQRMSIAQPLGKSAVQSVPRVQPFSKHEAFVSFIRSTTQIPSTKTRSNSAAVVGPNSLFNAFYFEKHDEISADVVDMASDFQDMYQLFDAFKLQLDVQFGQLCEFISEAMKKLTNSFRSTRDFQVFQKELVTIFEKSKDLKLKNAIDKIETENKIQRNTESKQNMKLLQNCELFKAVQLIEMILSFILETNTIQDSLKYLETTTQLQNKMQEVLGQRTIFDLIGVKRTEVQVIRTPSVQSKPILKPEPEKVTEKKPEAAVKPVEKKTEQKVEEVVQKVAEIEKVVEVIKPKEPHKYDLFLQELKEFEFTRNNMSTSEITAKVAELEKGIVRTLVGVFGACMCNPIDSLQLTEVIDYIRKQLDLYLAKVQKDAQDDVFKMVQILSKMHPLILKDQSSFLNQSLKIAAFLNVDYTMPIFYALNKKTELKLSFCAIKHQGVEYNIAKFEKLTPNERFALKKQIESEICKCFGMDKYEAVFAKIQKTKKLQTQVTKDFSNARYNNYYELFKFYREVQALEKQFGCKLGIVGTAVEDMVPIVKQNIYLLSLQERNTLYTKLQKEICSIAKVPDFFGACQKLYKTTGIGKSYANGMYNNIFELINFWEEVKRAQ